MRVSATTTSPPESGADTLAIGVFDGETVAHDVKGEALQRLIDAGEARTAFRHVAVAHAADAVAAGFVEGTVMAAYRFDRYKRATGEARDVQELIVSAHHDVSAPVEAAAVVAEAANAARDLQNAPANDLTPAALAGRARELEGVSVEVHGRSFLLERGMGAFAAVAHGSDVEPALIVLRYDGADARGPVLGLIGKAVT